MNTPIAKTFNVAFFAKSDKQGTYEYGKSQLICNHRPPAEPVD